MLNSPKHRRTLAILLVAAGATLTFLAPETWAGAFLLSAGMAIELVGIALKHRSQPK